MSHSLPNRALTLISEYSKPITRPNWRKSKPIITPYRLYLHVRNVLDLNNFTHYNTLYHIVLCGINGTEWYYAYYYTKCYGYHRYINHFNNVLTLDVDGIQDASTQFTIHDILYNSI
jgi:hypothetical protein